MAERYQLVPLSQLQEISSDGGHAEEVEYRVTLGQAWLRLPAYQRRVLQLAGEGLTHAQAAHQLGLSERSARYHHQQAKAALQAELWPTI